MHIADLWNVCVNLFHVYKNRENEVSEGYEYLYSLVVKNKLSVAPFTNMV